MNNAITRLFLSSSLSSAVTSGLNLLITVLIVRWYGSTVYANYAVDLAILSILLIILEAVPSNYSVFRAQDDHFWQASLAAHAAANLFLSVAIVYSTNLLTGYFSDYSKWMPVYALSLAIKRYLDIRLQSTGRLAEYLRLDMLASCTRVPIIALAYQMEYDDNFAVWGALAVSCLFSQAIWFARNPSEFRLLAGCMDSNAWRNLFGGTRQYLPYYLGIGLKRARDNLMPIAAQRIFVSDVMLAAFLLSYRGVVFAVGQIRILEAILNHRASLELIRHVSRARTLVIALSAQVLCLLASGALVLASEAGPTPWFQIIVLSFLVWPIVFLILERAKAYSNFEASRVNGSIAAYITTLIGGTLFYEMTAMRNPTAFAALLLAAEFSALFALSIKSRTRDAEQN